MTTNKPEPVAWMTHHDEPMLFPSKSEADSYCGDGEEPVALVRLSDYEALQAECEKLRKDVSALVETLTELCDEIDKHDIHAAISKTSISWFKRNARKALADHRKGR